MARMLGYQSRPWCPYHRTHKLGLDCPDSSKSKGQARATEKKRWRREVLGILASRTTTMID
jgi:hypothetical protein